MAVVPRCTLCLSVQAKPDPDIGYEGIILVPIWNKALVCQICARDAVTAHARRASTDAEERPPWPGRFLALRSGKPPTIPCDTIPCPPPSGARR